MKYSCSLNYESLWKWNPRLSCTAYRKGVQAQTWCIYMYIYIYTHTLNRSTGKRSICVLYLQKPTQTLTIHFRLHEFQLCDVPVINTGFITSWVIVHKKITLFSNKLKHEKTQAFLRLMKRGHWDFAISWWSRAVYCRQKTATALWLVLRCISLRTNTTLFWPESKWTNRFHQEHFQILWQSGKGTPNVINGNGRSHQRLMLFQLFATVLKPEIWMHTGPPISPTLAGQFSFGR